MIERILAMFGVKSINLILDSFSRVTKDLENFVAREEANVSKILTKEAELASKREIKLNHIGRAKTVKGKIDDLLS